MAEENKQDLSTDSQVIDYFNRRIEEVKENDPELSTLSPVAFGVAKQYGQASVFPFGLIGFPESAKNPNEIDDYVQRVIQGSIDFTQRLKTGEASELIASGIENFKGFRESNAANDFLAATRTTFETAKSNLLELKSAERNAEENVENPFENNPAFKKMTSDDIQSLLSFTMLNFLKEIGISRDAVTEERDRYFFESGQKAFELAQGSVATTVQTEPQRLNTEEDRALAEAKRKEAEETALLSSKSGSNATTQSGTSNVVTSSNQPVTAQPVVVTPATTTIVEKTQTTVVERNPLEREEVPVVAQTTSAGTNLVEQAQAPVTPTPTNTEIDYSDNPLLRQLGRNLGFTRAQMKEMFGGESGAKIAEGLKNSLKEEVVPVANTVQETKEILSTSNGPVATRVSEPVKMAEQVTPPPPPPPAPATEVTPVPVSTLEAANTTSTPETSENKGETKDETKPSQETMNKEESTTNSELLRVMKQILITLQGPLITTDGGHKFH